jgi:MoxR-like ATPase
VADKLSRELVKDLAKFDTEDCLKYVQAMDNPQVAEIVDCVDISLGRLRRLVDCMNSWFEDKKEIAELMMISAIAMEPMLLFGPPGTAKSELVTRFADALGVRRLSTNQPAVGSGGAPGPAAQWKTYFEYLLNQYTEPDELMGPVLINELLQDPPRFARARTGMLPDACVVFMDEIFRANSAILNALLSLINERQVYEAGQPVPARTMILFGAANRPPVSEELAAFYERFPLRVASHPVPVLDSQAAVTRPERFSKRFGLLKKGMDLEVKRQKVNAGLNKSQIQQEACLADIVLCNKALMIHLLGSRDYLGTRQIEPFLLNYAEMVQALNMNGNRLCNIDDRKFIKLFKLIVARAMYSRGILEDGDKTRPTCDDMEILKHTWADADLSETLSETVRAHIANLKTRKATA